MKLSKEKFNKIMGAPREMVEFELRLINQYSWWNGGFRELVPDAPSYARKAESHILLRGQYNNGLSYEDYILDESIIRELSNDRQAKRTIKRVSKITR